MCAALRPNNALSVAARRALASPLVACFRRRRSPRRLALPPAASLGFAARRVLGIEQLACSASQPVACSASQLFAPLGIAARRAPGAARKPMRKPLVVRMIGHAWGFARRSGRPLREAMANACFRLGAWWLVRVCDVYTYSVTSSNL